MLTKRYWRKQRWVCEYINFEKCFYNSKISLIPDLLKGDIVENDNIEYIKAKDITISSDTKLESDIDGDQSDDLPVKITVLGNHIEIYSL